MNTILEHIILQNSHRGMDILSKYMPNEYCREAAEALFFLSPGTIILTTGFYVQGHAETDGPLGTAALVYALRKMGHDCIVLTDSYCYQYFEFLGIQTIYIDKTDVTVEEILKQYQPSAIISVERCGKNAKDRYWNMNANDITLYTSSIDKIFPIAKKRGILTVGIGDGGNEIGMGNYENILSKELGLEPCVIKTDYLIISSVSNWGAYGLCGYLSDYCGKTLLPEESWLQKYMLFLQSCGCIDGVTKQNTLTVDGYIEGKEVKVFREIQRWVKNVVEKRRSEKTKTK